MKKILLTIIITFVVVISLVLIILSFNGNKEKKLEVCKEQCRQDISLGRIEGEGEGLLGRLDYSDRNACIQMCIEKYK